MGAYSCCADQVQDSVIRYGRCGSLAEDAEKRADRDHWLDHGRVHNREEDWKVFRDHFLASVQTSPAAFTAWYFLGWSYDELGEYDKAIEAYEEATRLKHAASLKPRLSELHTT